MRILCVWMSEYFSGTTDERFLEPLKRIGFEVDVFPLKKNCESNLLRTVKYGNYDYLLHVPYRNSIRKEVLRAISDGSTTTIAWNGDDEWLWEDKSENGTEFVASLHNWCVTTSSNSVKKYKDIGYKNVVLAQWGVSRSQWVPKKVKKIHDVYFCGSRDEHRFKFLMHLLQNGIKVKADGPGFTKTGKIALQDMVDGFRRAKIGINFTFGDKNGFQYNQVKARNFEIPAVRTFQLSEDAPDLKRFFKNESEIVTFKGLNDMLNWCRYYLKKEDERESIARAGYERVQEHTYENIFKRVFEEIERGKK